MAVVGEGELLQPVVGQLSQGLTRGDKQQVEDLLIARINSGMSVVDTNVTLIQPAMYEVGRLWQTNQISVAQEHMATAICQNVMSRTFALADFSAKHEQRALFACVEGNHHGLGLRMVSDAFDINGWQADYLGEDTPTESIIKQLDQNRCDLLGVSISLPNQFKSLRQLAEALKAEFGNNGPALMVGGQSMNMIDDLWKQINADLYATDAKTAIEIANG